MTVEELPEGRRCKRMHVVIQSDCLTRPIRSGADSRLGRRRRRIHYLSHPDDVVTGTSYE
ncbi:hypothetical protein GCM10011574_32300 [Microbispora bryophytorum]|uniref:Uncharacterized protein n=1 Tax=Microbispora bryophytorum TaxID=1460882 RepID=A0A8H9H4M9_9ACTN|nr:hypothetical protein GCM10011574_32300 [Microbispora bryophytorum]